MVARADGVNVRCNSLLRLREVIAKDRVTLCKGKDGKEETERFLGCVTQNTIMLQEMNEC